MRKPLIFILIPFLFLCKGSDNSSDDKKSIFQNMSLLFIRSNRATISGTAVKGIVKNGTVTINPLGTNGICNTSTVLASDTTDETGNYSLMYNKTGGIVCLTVSSNLNGKTTVFDEKLNADVSVAAGSSFNLVTILPESKITGNSRKNTMISPFSKMLGRRLQSLIKQAGDGADTNALYKKASKEIVIRFGLSSGLSTASGKASIQTRAATAPLTDADYPEMDDIIIELENPNSPLSAKFITILSGFSHLANKHKKGGAVSADDIDSIIDAFASDFEDGLFDGKSSDGKAVTIGTGANQVTFSSTPLTNTLLPAIVSYIKEGGKLSAGRPNTTPVTITTTQITNQIQFVDNAPIISTTVTVNASTFTIGGTISGLTSTGLVLQNNAGDNLTVASGATSFVFTTALASGASYGVTVQTQPTGQICSVANGSGAVSSANVTNLSVTCNKVSTVAFYTASSSGMESTTAVTIPVSLSEASSQTVTVNYSVTSGTATGSGTDYTLEAGTLTFAAGTTVQNISATVVSDTLSEANETIIVTLTTPSAATLGTNTAHTYTITDDDAIPTVAFNTTTSSGAESTTAVSIPVSLSAASGQTVTVNYSVTGGTATGSGTDYTLAAGTLTFTAGTTVQNISATIVNDTLNETNDTIIVTLASPALATLGTNTAHTYTITDDDAIPTVAFNTTASSGAESTTAVTIPVSLSAASGQTVTVNYSVTGGTATGSGTDYTLAAGTLTFAAGTTVQNISATIVNDTLNETNDTIIVILATPALATLGTNTAHTYTIIDDDTAPTVAFNTITSSGAESTTVVTIPVSLSAVSGQIVTVNYSLGGAATGGGTDYTLAAGTLTFAAGTTSQNISATVINDTLSETNETIIVNLVSPAQAILGTNTAHTYTITDDDTAPTVAFTGTASSGAESTTAVSIPVSLSAASGQTVTVNYSLGGTATGGGADYTLAAGTLTFAAGTTVQNISATVVSDTLNETNETIIVTLTAPSAATLGTNTAHTYTITDDDTAPTVAFNATTSSGAESTTAVTIPVSLSAASGQTVTVNYSLGGTATGGGTDYTLAAGTLTFAAGTTVQNISATVVSDTLNETNETIIVTLASPALATLGTNTAHTYTITDDDTAPTVAFVAASSNSTNETASNRTIAVNLSSASSFAISVTVTDGGGTATNGVDYTAIGSPLTVNFAAGEITKNVTIPVISDTVNEANETIVLTLGSPTNATLGGQTTHTFTIIDDDGTPTVAFGAASSNSIDETTVSRTIAVNLSAASGQAISVVVTDGGGTATSGTDYTAIGSPLTVNFAAGDLTKNVTIPVLSDTIDEANETIVLTLGSPTNATLGAQTTHTFTIIDDDVTPTVAFTVASQSSANETGTMTITAQVSSVSGQNISVPFTVNGSSTAIGGTDYTITGSPITINAGSTGAVITVTIVSDTLDEVNEAVVVDMGTPTNATASGITTHTATITDDDVAPTVTFAGAGSNSTDETAASRTIAINLSAESGQAISVVVTDAGGTATSGTDYTPIGSPLTVNFVAGEITKNVTIPVLSDTVNEANETIVLTLGAPTNATLGTQTTHTFTIIDDDIGIVSAETMDCNNNGKIDHYKLTFAAVVTDTTFPGYSANSLGTTTVDWVVGGGTYSNVRLEHGTAVNTSCAVTDTVNDTILYLTFTEGGSFDTGVKPDLTTTATPQLSDGTKTVGVIATLTLTEADRAKPLITNAVTSNNQLTITFSEPVYSASGVPSCGVGGQLDITDVVYSDVSTSGVSSLTGMGVDNCATADSNAVFVGNATFNTGDSVDTVAASSTGLFDAANNLGNASAAAKTLTVAQYTIGGNVSGLTSGTLVLHNNAGNNLSITTSGGFAFSAAISNGTTYNVTIFTQPVGHTCSVTSGGTGTATANVTNVTVSCTVTYTVGGTISGLSATGLVLRNNNADSLTVANGSSGFTFATPINTGTSYSVTVFTHPTGQICQVTNGTGTISANVTNVTVTCIAEPANTTLWAKSLTTGTNNANFNKAAIDSLGNIYAVGVIYGTTAFDFGSGGATTVTGSNTAHSPVIVKYDSSGVAQWAKTATGGNIDFRSIAIDTSNNIYVVGTMAAITANFGVASVTALANPSIVVVKYDTNGNSVWARTNSTGAYIKMHTVSTDSTGNIYAVGEVGGTGSYTFGSGTCGTDCVLTGLSSQGVPYIAKYASNGDHLFVKTVTSISSATSYQNFMGLAVDSANNCFYAAGMIGSNVNFGGTSTTVNLLGANGTGTAVLVKYDLSGSAIWAVTPVSAAGTANTSFNSVTISGTDVVVLGNVNSPGAHDFGNSVNFTSPFNGQNLLLAKYNSSGVAQWARTAVTASDGSAFNDVKADSSGNIYIVGMIQSAIGNFKFENTDPIFTNGVMSWSNSSPILIKYNSTGVAQWPHRTIVSVSNTGVSATYLGLAVTSTGTVYAVGDMRSANSAIPVTYNYGTIGTPVNVDAIVNSSFAYGNWGQNPMIVKYQ